MQFQSQGHDICVPAENSVLGWWMGASPSDHSPEAGLAESLRFVRRPLFLVNHNGTLIAKTNGSALLGGEKPETGALPLMGYATPCPPENLGDTEFCRELSLCYPYLGGSMAKGISSVAMVEELGQAGMLGFFGAAGLPFSDVEAACSAW